MAELLYRPKSEAAKAFTNDLAQQLTTLELRHGLRTRRRSVQAHKNMLASLAAYWADLVKHAGNKDALGFCYRSTKQEGYDGTLVERRQIEAVREFCIREGLIEVIPGYRPSQGFEGEKIVGPVSAYRAQRIRATPALLEQAARHGITPSNISDHVEYVHAASLPVVLKKRKKSKNGRPEAGQTIATKQNKNLILLAEPLITLNTFLDQQTFNLPTQPRLKRVFNNVDDQNFSWDRGGRIYAVGNDNYQNMKMEKRKGILINGEETLELDVSASHLSIYLAQVGKLVRVSRDLYSVMGFSRTCIKQVVLAAFGRGELPTRWGRGVKDIIAEADGIALSEVPKVRLVVDALIDKYPSFKCLKGSGMDWSKLQFLESEAFLSVMLKLMNEHQVPSLPVHDSLIVPKSKAGLTKELLTKAYIDQIGVAPLI
ncbi:hypothetical protein K3759_01255 [Sulfitobacter sp. W027]|uniref:hypothetical protein n=1 Tax=Sulfitobacter sp. W027 TaxID=2867025 RepID=UPI0021A3969E|nr:hypothetical protein [Sulfitobacter sp. W027]UWR33754.1 hypothetical protein K3759_01255 [Sulfitobacter sp. W027]